MVYSTVSGAQAHASHALNRLAPSGGYWPLASLLHGRQRLIFYLVAFVVVRWSKNQAPPIIDKTHKKQRLINDTAIDSVMGTPKAMSIALAEASRTPKPAKLIGSSMARAVTVATTIASMLLIGVPKARASTKKHEARANITNTPRMLINVRLPIAKDVAT